MVRNIDARKLSVLENMFGRSFVGTNGPNPTSNAATLLNESYRKVFEIMYGRLTAFSHLVDLHGSIIYTWDGEAERWHTDLSSVTTTVQDSLSTDSEQGQQLLSEFARSVRGIGLLPQNDYLSFRGAFIQQDPSLGWVIDTGGLPVIDRLGQGTRPWSVHILGTYNADAVLGSLTVGDACINGETGNDVIYGTDRNELLINETGDALLVAGGGNDTIWAGADDDILDGGEGNDVLMGEAGNDTYIFRRGSGQDLIIDPDPTPNNIDTIWLGSNLTPDEIALIRSVKNLVLKIIGSTDTLAVQDYFRTTAA